MRVARLGSLPLAVSFLAHLAILQVDDEGKSATWGDHVTDDEYGAAPAIDS
jgi:hypothetical protein